jgi:hypothetical protein
MVGDTVPAMLTPGEFVMNRDAVGRIGLPALNAMNSGAGMGSTVMQEFEFNLAINVSAAGGDLSEGFIRQRIMPTIRDELKQASQRGDFVMSEKGLRR